MNRLLQRQITKCLAGYPSDDPAFKSFLEAVAKTYDEFEQDKKFLAHTLEVASSELTEANERLRLENEGEVRRIRDFFEQTLDLQPNIIFRCRRETGRFVVQLARGGLMGKLLLHREQVEQTDILETLGCAEKLDFFETAWGGRDQRFELFLGPSRLYCEVALHPLEIGSGVVELIGVVSDITGQKTVEEKLRVSSADLAARAKELEQSRRVMLSMIEDLDQSRTNIAKERDRANALANEAAVAARRLKIQYRVAEILAEAADFSIAAPEILKAVCENLNWPLGIFWQPVEGGKALQFFKAWRKEGASYPEFVRTSSAMIFSRGEGLPGRILQGGESFWIRDVSEDRNFPRAAIATLENLHGAFGFPVIASGEVFGVAEFFSEKLEVLDANLLQVFQAVGSQIGQFVVRRKTEAALLATSSLQRGILESANYAIISTTPEGVILSFNPAAEKMLGYAADELIGKCTPAVIHDHDEVGRRACELSTELGREVSPSFETFIVKVGPNRPDEREWTYVRKDGSRFPVMLSVTALYDVEGGITGYLGVASDITERKRAAERLQAETQLLAVTLGNITTSVITVDVQRRVTLMNSGAEKLTLWSLKEAQGRSMNEIFALANETGQGSMNPVDAVFSTGAAFGDVHTVERPMTLLDRGGKEHIIVASAAPMHNAEGRLIGVVLVFRDISSELEAERLKRDFVSSVSHELRTPLTSIQGFVTTILREPEMPVDVRNEFLQIVQDQSTRLKNLVDDILDISRIESGRVTLDEEPVDIIAIARETLIDIETDVHRRNQNLETVFAEKIPVIIGDAGKLRSVLTNLLSNASKFTPDGGTISLTIMHVLKGIDITVTDTGFGIPEKDLPKIFEKFYRVQRDGMQIQGTGLGLAIVKSIVTKHGGTIEVKSALNKGTSFRVHFPVR